MSAKISIALTTFNGERYIEEQLDSILAQTHGNFEIIACDDDSTDSTFAILQRYAQTYPRIKVYRNTQRLGFLANFAKALSLCDANYIALCDQDDIWKENKLEKELAALLDKEIPGHPILVHSDLVLIGNDRKVIEESYFKFRNINLPPHPAFNLIISHNGVMGNTILMNRALLQAALPFPPALKYHDFWFALINEAIGQRITLADQLVLYRIHEDNTSNSLRNVSKRNNIFFIIRKSLKLPFINQATADTLKELLLRHKLKPENEKLAQTFINYIEKRENRLHVFVCFTRNKLFGSNILSRLMFLMKLMVFYRKKKRL